MSIKLLAGKTRASTALSADLLRELLDYAAETGVFKWVQVEHDTHYPSPTVTEPKIPGVAEDRLLTDRLLPLATVPLGVDREAREKLAGHVLLGSVIAPGSARGAAAGQL